MRISLFAAAVCAFSSLHLMGQSTPPTPVSTPVPAPAPTPPPINPLVQARVKCLQKGLNLSHWFSQVKPPLGYTKDHFRTFVTADDLALIHSLGCDHIRLPVAPEPMFDPAHPQVLPAWYLTELDTAIQNILDHGLAVIVDLHPDAPFKKSLASDPAMKEEVAQFWEQFARHLSKYDPNRVFLEVLNEPNFNDNQNWMQTREKLVEAIRRGAPHHTLIVGGDQWSGLHELYNEDILADTNVIYNFHHYSPTTFTHQGATWGQAQWKDIAGLAYPASAANVAQVLSALNNPAARKDVTNYGIKNWNGSIMEQEMAETERWAKVHGVAVICDEFGVYKLHTDEASRQAWLSDVVGAMERHGIGWTMWDYAGGFGIGDKYGDKMSVDPATLRSLQLDQPAVAQKAP